MRYLMQMYSTADEFGAAMAAYSPEDLSAMVTWMKDFDAELRASGELVDDQGLAGPETLTTVQARDGADPLVTTGPASPSTPFLVGYWLIDVADQARAVALAARVSASPGAGARPNNIPVTLSQVAEAPPA
ncbi:hypothetical protein BIV57_18100 [Mangrovactinospora gilvigrisea]|uniref:YCII-related domain-containing protein n=1 Tax=Mangrovactinospora gilvigrisea TaxID=1428644 RepID=A0A1J7C3G9_9ACTN|nr:YciI family protein [Mangrovactinospora gilvigrisea]OIV36100.1 hypothetical protein BIV57_18100 [Mangrovactinospora gilvigrisea]